MSVKGFIKASSRILFYLFLVTLPFNFQAYIAGALFAKYHNDSIPKGIKLWMQELDQWSWMEQWSVPGAPTIWEHQNNVSPFLITQLRSNSWRDVLGVTSPYQHHENFADEAAIDKLVAFDGAARDMTTLCSTRPTEFWVYVSSLAMPAVYKWDQAFVELLEYHEMHPTADNASLAYVDCASSPFLCHVWQVSYPALMHFKILEDETVEGIDTDAFTTPPEQLRPLEVRIFDLGLQQDVSPLLPGQFPSRLEQMKALTSNEGANTIEEEYNEITRAYRRFNDLYYFPAIMRQGSFLDYVSDFDHFLLKKIAKPIGLEGVMDTVAGVGFAFSLALTTLFYLVKNPVSDFWSNFLGNPTEIDELAERIQEREAVAARGGIFGDASHDFVDWIEDLVLSSATESAEQPAVTTQKDEIKNLFAGLRANISSIWQGT